MPEALREIQQRFLAGVALDDAAAEAKYGKLDKKLPYLRFARTPRLG